MGGPCEGLRVLDFSFWMAGRSFTQRRQPAEARRLILDLKAQQAGEPVHHVKPAFTDL